MQYKTLLFLLLFPFFLYQCSNSAKDEPNVDVVQPNQEELRDSANETANYLEIGQKIAFATKGVLGKNLMEAINTKGTEHALSFCSTKAISLTDSMSVVLNAKIKRVSDKNRNPDNECNEAELSYILATKLALAENKETPPLLTTLGDKLIGYYPIITNQMCMQCHGQPETEVLPQTLSKIGMLYPQDKALGYNVNELRGIWVVEMDNVN